MQTIHPPADVGHQMSNPQPATRNPQSWCVKLLVLMQIFTASALQSVVAQCCPDHVLLDASLNLTEILPFCDEIVINTSIDNSGDDCAVDVILRISFGATGGTGPTESFNYLGSLPFSEDTWANGSDIFRRFNFLLSVPDQEIAINPLRFSLTPDDFTLAPDYAVFVDVVPQDLGCDQDPGTKTFLSSFTVSSRVIEIPISGSVIDLIASNDLLPNSASNPTVERKTIHGVLEVDEDYSFDGSGGSSLARPKLYLGPGAQILVKSGFVLTLTNADIFTCDELAQGIVVEPGATLIMDGCLVSDSRFGIDAQAGSTISVTDNDFVDNYIGARFHMAGSPNRVFVNAFSGNDFFTDDGVKAPFSGMPEAVETRGLCGISVNNYRDFNVWGGNSFSQLANGIIAQKSSGNLGNMTFEDMNSAGNVYLLEGYGIHLSGKTTQPMFFNINEFWTSMTFDDCKTGIFANNHALNVENTTMTNVDVGIDVSQSQIKDIVLDGNDITARKQGIRSFFNEPVHAISTIRNNDITITNLGTGTAPVTGIEMEEGAFSATLGDGWTVSGNDIEVLRGGRGISYRSGMYGTVKGNTVNNQGLASSGVYQGIRVEGAAFTQVDFNDVTQSSSDSSNATSRAIYSAAGWANGFTCNCVDNTGVGLQFYDMADFTNNVRGNKLNTHDDTGLQLGDDVQGNTFIGTQYHTGNEWVVAPSGFGGVHWGTSINVIKQSEFFVDPNEKSGALNPPVDPSEGWFVPQATEPPSFDCSNGCSAPSTPPTFEGEGDVPTKLDAAIAADTLPTDGWATETRWKGAYRLYRKILRRPAIESYAQVYADFKDDNENLSTGKLAYIAEERSKLFELGSTEATTAESRRSAWRQKMDELRELDSLRQSGTAVNQTQYNNAAQQVATTQTQYEQYLDTLRTIRLQQVATLLSLNAAVSTSLAIEANHKTLNNIVLKILLSDTLASSDLPTLADIAEQCPLEGGDAVYEARAMVAYFTGEDFDDYELCASSERQQRVQKKNTTRAERSIEIYPNPTTGEVFLAADGEVLVRIFDNIGQLQLEKIVSDHRLDLSQLQPGIYRLQLFREGQMLTTQSVVLLNR